MIGRRRFLHCSLCASGGLLLGCGSGSDARDGGSDAACDDAFAGGALIGVMSFVGEDIPLEIRIGEGWDGRLFTDLSRIDRAGSPVSKERHYLRTFFPDLLDPARPWQVEVRP